MRERRGEKGRGRERGEDKEGVSENGREKSQTLTRCRGEDTDEGSSWRVEAVHTQFEPPHVITNYGPVRERDE